MTGRLMLYALPVLMLMLVLGCSSSEPNGERLTVEEITGMT